VPEAHGKLKPELARLHVASVKLQQWVVQNERSAPNTSRSTTLQDHSRSLLNCCGNADTWQSWRGERHE